MIFSGTKLLSMMRLKFVFAVFCFVTGIQSFASAQATISPGEIKKIHLIDSEWALGFSRLTEFDIVNENGQWNCYQTKQKYPADRFGKDKDYFAKENSDSRKFVKKIDNDAIEGLLGTINTVKPDYNWQIYGIDTYTLATTVDTVYLKNWEKKMSAMDHLIFVNELQKAANVKAAIDSLQHYWWTDDSPVCAIEIIKHNNDTVKIYANKQMDYMLPWIVNNTPSYDLNINKFFASAVGDYRYSNRNRLIGDNFIYKIQEYIYNNFATEAIIRYNWNKKFPKQYKLLNTLFDITNLSYQTEGIRLFAKNKQLPQNFVIYAAIAMGNDTAITRLVQFKNQLRELVKKGNFVFDYYKNVKKATISFSLQDNATGNLALYNKKFKAWLQKNDSTIFNSRSILRFSAGSQYWDSQDWLLLPDNRLILLSYFKANIAGVSYSPLETGDNSRKDCFVLFDDKGNLISENP